MASEFYKKAEDYWSAIPPTVNGVLGGFDFISDIDIEGSRTFLEEIFSTTGKKRPPPEKKLALDCGAGIGRITNSLLSKYFDKIDLVEQNEAFLEKAKEFIVDSHKMGTMYKMGLQDFVPDKKYDIIWNQWVLGHLKDDDLIQYFIRCGNGLSRNGLIIVKENVTSSNKLEVDDVDSSVTRPLHQLLSIFKRAKLKRVKEWKQNNFPKGIYPVYMFALRPVVQNSISENDIEHLINSCTLSEKTPEDETDKR